MFNVIEHIIPCSFVREYPRATANGENSGLSLAVKQYIPSQPCDPSFQKVTVIGAHGNGCPKELYEPLWEDLHGFLLQHNIGIQSIWMADSAHQGVSSLLNEEKLGDDPSLLDHPRDLLHLINHFQDQMTLPIIGIGHSMGGTHLLQTSLMHGRLFHGLVLIEPVLYDAPAAHVKFGPAYLAASRRDRWESKEQLITHTTQSKAYRAWDARVLQRWFDYGVCVRRTATGAQELTLKTTKHQEAFALARPNWVSPFSKQMAGLSEAQKEKLTEMDRRLIEHANDPFLQPEPMIVFENLPFLKPSTLYMYGALSDFLKIGGLRKRAVERTGSSVLGSGGVERGKVKQMEIDKGGHMAPMEQPTSIARDIAAWVAHEVRVWKEAVDQAAMEWRGKEGGQKRMLDEAFLSHLGLKKSGSKGKL